MKLSENAARFMHPGCYVEVRPGGENLSDGWIVHVWPSKEAAKGDPDGERSTDRYEWEAEDLDADKPWRRKVHVVDRDGKPLYNQLLDDGTNVLRFEGTPGSGFIARDAAKREGWEIRPGWLDCFGGKL